MTEKKQSYQGLDLWNRVCKTDPDHTKHVGQRGGFTAIDAYYQIQCATEEFGPAGYRWGWEIVDVEFTPNDMVAILIKLWWGYDECEIYQWGQCSLWSDAKGTRRDEDCFKKATTDGITKCLSYLGFNADVFLGKYDDSKYVQALKREKAEEKAREEAPKIEEKFQEIRNLLETAADENALAPVLAVARDFIKAYPARRSDITALVEQAKSRVAE